MKMQESSPFFGAVEYHFFQAGGARKNQLVLRSARCSRQVVQPMESYCICIKVAEPISKFFDGFRHYEAIGAFKCLVQVVIIYDLQG